MVESLQPARIMLLDVGANDGSWSKAVLFRCANLMGGARARAMTELHVFEPQPRFVQDLAMMVRNWPFATVHNAAAWTNDARNLTFYLSRQSTSASLLPIVAKHAGQPRRGDAKISVRTVNLAAFLAARLPPRPNASKTLVALKLDVEAAEFDLLPHLLAAGVLCRVHLFVVEWHLNALAPEKRLAGLGLRLSLSSLLRTGCGARVRNEPITIHEGAPINNWEQQVPDLWDIALYHNGTPVPGQPPSRLVRAWETSRQWLESQGAEERNENAPG